MRGDPQAPLPRTPRPVTALRVRQRADQLEISYQVPRATTGGVVLPMVEIQILRAEPEGDINKVGRVRSRRAAPGETLVDHEPLPPVGTRLRFAVRAVSRGKTSALSEVVAVEVVEQPTAPLALKTEATVRGVLLTWQGLLPPMPPAPSPEPSPSPAGPSATPAPAATPTRPPHAPRPDRKGPALHAPRPDGKPSPSPHAPRSDRKASPAPHSSQTPPPAAAPAAPKPVALPSRSGFLVYRRAPEGEFGAPLAPNPVRALAYEDGTAKPGEKWCYVARSVVSTVPFVESAASNEACQVVADVDPPAPPVGLQVQLRDDGAHLVWSPSPERDVAGYEVYRSLDGSEPESIARLGVEQTAFIDTAPPPGRRLQYSLRAVDRAGNWSQLSRVVEVRR